MELGRVVGQVVSTVRDHGLPNVTLLMVDLIDAQGNVKLTGKSRPTLWVPVKVSWSFWCGEAPPG